MTKTDKTQSFVELTRPYNALPLLLGIAIGSVLAGSDMTWDLATAMVIVLLLHSSANLANDITDLDVDGANRRKSALLDRSITVETVRRVILLIEIVALTIAITTGQPVVHLVAVSVFIALAWLYNSKPFLLSRRPVVSIMLLGVYYTAAPLTYGYLIGGGELNGYFAALVFFWVLARMSISIMKDYKDAHGDKKFHKLTFYLRYGHKVTAWASVGLMLAGYTGIAWLLLANLGTFTPVFIVPGLLVVLNVALRLRQIAISDEGQLAVIFRKSFFAHSHLEIVLLVCLIFFWH